MSRTFLKAEWRKLIMINYKVSPDLLKDHVPFKTELDLRNDICYVSLVGFMFLNVKVKGIVIPFHKDFEEVNLRFYVKHKDQNSGEWKRGVVFIKEIVPKPLIALVANVLYGENYESMKMDHSWKILEQGLEISYGWSKNGRNSIKVLAEKSDSAIQDNNEEEFITEHYWGYTKLGKMKTSEYEVIHPKWSIYRILEHEIKVDFGKIYGTDFSFLNNEKPLSMILAEGSEIKVKEGRKIH